MANTHGFEVVIEATPPVLRKALQGAWKSAECGDTSTDEGRIPQYLPVPAGLGFGGFTTAGGQVEIPRDQLDAAPRPDIDGCELTLGLIIQLVVADPPVPSAQLLDLTATARAAVPIGVLPDSKNVGLRFDGLPRSAVTATLTSGDPLAPKLVQILGEYIHFAYENGGPGGVLHPGIPAIPHEQDDTGLVLGLGVGSYTLDTHLEIYDDQAEPAHRIDVSRPDPGHILISMPIYLRMFHIVGAGAAPALADPMGVETRLAITVPLETPPGAYTLRFDTATVAAGPINPAPGVEGTHFTTNNATLFGFLDNALQVQLNQQGAELVHGFGAQTVTVPTVAQIETAIGDLLFDDLAGRGFLALWTPEAGGEVFEADNVATRVFADLLVIAINAGEGADIGAMTNVVPAGRDFAILLNGAIVQQNIDAARVANGWADNDLPRRVDQDGDKADVRELDVVLRDGSIRMTGEITVIDAILGSIDVDASFRADVGLHWTPSGSLNPDGVQRMDNHLIGEPDVDPEESVLFWVIAVILAIISFGAGSILIGIIIIVVAAVITAVVNNIGGSRLVDPVTGAVSGITGWPPELARIGRVRAVFFDPIVINADGLVLAGDLEVLSSCESTEVLAARSGGPYTGTAQSALLLAAGHTSAAAGYTWLTGDGAPSVTTVNVNHVYAASGVYLAAHSLTINEPGGATSNHFALVYVANVPPTVDAGPDLTVDEGEVVTLVGRFTDVEYADTHETTWNFGDAQPTEPGTVVETNTPPRAEGTSTVQHAWCDNGVYQVTLRVRDQNGGMATDTRTVTVRNVPPVVDAGPDLFTYPCTVLTLTARFTDPGWCDTHTAVWEFGDCTPPLPAVVDETHEPPAGRGVAVLSHRYPDCGTFVARCTVTDDDGGVGVDELVVRAVDVVNRHFEDGFAQRATGQVANGWEPYVLAGSAPTGTGQHAASNFVVHGGRRSQGLVPGPQQRVGVRQRIGANPGWEYQLTAWYDLDEADPATARLGVDPTGGTDPTSTAVVWSDGTTAQRWSPLTVRVAARAAAVTVFLEATADRRDSRQGGGRVWFDDVDLLAVQPYCPPESPPPSPRDCLDFADREPGTQYPIQWTDQGFGIRSLDDSGRVVVALGPPTGGAALQLGIGVRIDLPRPAQRVVVTLVNQGGRPVEVTAYDDDGAELDRAEVPATAAPVPTTVTLTGPGIVAVRIVGRAAEGLLVRLCAEYADDDGSDDDSSDGPSSHPAPIDPAGTGPTRPPTRGGCCG
ncbi:PKD domain-containing protein [Micromonospora sp. NPDC005220]|uniref:PKD domain-containing protein n=1 Tax=Micromonospora sp. NPDC005220 TaxID=3155589 RepID=UPI0033B10657